MTKTIDEIYQEMRSEYTKATGIVMSDSGDMALRMKALAAQLHSLWIQADWMRKQVFPQTASGEHLEYHAQIRGVARKGATTAIGRIEFYINESVGKNLEIPIGTVCLTEGGTEFITSEAATIYAGELRCIAGAYARNAGEAGNVPSESIFRMAEAPIGVVGCMNPLSFSGGSEPEKDEALRERVMASYRRLPNGANKAYYESLVLSIDEVKKVVVLPKVRGIGTVDVVIAAEEGAPSQALKNQVAEMLEENREICVDVLVKSPMVRGVPMAVQINIEDGYVFDDVQADVKLALERYFTGERLGEDVLLAQLGLIVFAVEGVKNYKFVLPANDVLVGEAELPVLMIPLISNAG